MSFCRRLIQTYLIGLPISTIYHSINARKDYRIRKENTLDSYLFSRDLASEPELYKDNIAEEYREIRKDVINKTISDTIFYPVHSVQYLANKLNTRYEVSLYKKDISEIGEKLKERMEEIKEEDK